jgi:hypothetical protein
MRALVAIGLVGCVLRKDVTHVMLRDPAAVAVAVAASGSAILPVGSACGDVPASAYIGDAEPGSWVERDGSAAGAIVAWCPRCSYVRRRVVVDGPALDLDGSASAVLRADGDLLHMRWTFDELRAEKRFDYRVPRIALDLVTPRANVAAIDDERHVRRNDGDAPLAISGMVGVGCWGALGGGLFAIGVHEHEAIAEVTGAAIVAIGATIVGLLVREYRARDEHHAIAP